MNFENGVDAVIWSGKENLRFDLVCEGIQFLQRGSQFRADFLALAAEVDQRLRIFQLAGNFLVDV